MAFRKAREAALPTSRARTGGTKVRGAIGTTILLGLVVLAFCPPATAQIIGSASMNVGRAGHSATRMQDGRVLIIGGENASGALRTAEAYDPTVQRFSLAGSLVVPRTEHTATLLADGRALITGGRQGGTRRPPGSGTPLASTEVFDAAAGSFSAGPSLKAARFGHTATPLRDGRILIGGGDMQGSAEIFDPTTFTFTALAASLTTPRWFAGTALLQDGTVVIAGGTDATGAGLNSAELFDPASSGFTAAGTALQVARENPLLRVLPDGKVLIIGGSDDSTVELFDPGGPIIRAYARVLNTSNTLADILRSRTRAALIHLMHPNDPLLQSQFTPALRGLLERTGHSLTEMPESNQALAAGGVDRGGRFLTSADVVGSSAATITTGRSDYPPGSTVEISGARWQPGETVRLSIHEQWWPPRQSPLANPDELYVATADPQGGFVNLQFSPDWGYLGRTFTATAVGQSSGFVAQTTFTDATCISGTGANEAPPNAAGGAQRVPILSMTVSCSTTSATLGSAQLTYTGTTAADISMLYLYRESGTTGGFQPSEDLLAGSVAITTTGTNVSLNVVTATGNNVVTPAGAKFYFAVDIKPGATNGHAVALAIPKTKIQFSDGGWPPSQIGPLGATTIGASATSIALSAAAVTYNANSVVTVMVTSASATPTGTVSLSVDNAAPISQPLTNGSTTFTLTSPTAGDHTLSASYPAQGSFAASNVGGTLHVYQATPTVGWSNPADITYGTALGGTQLNASAAFNGAPLPGTFTYTPAAGTVLNVGNAQTLHVDFTPTDSVNFTAASRAVTINVLSAAPTITEVTPSSGPAGTLVTITGTNFEPGSTQVAFNGAGALPRSISATALVTTVPVSATTGLVTVTTPKGTASRPFMVTTTQDFALQAAPAQSRVIQGASTIYTVSLQSLGAELFSGLAALSLEGLPSGATANFSPRFLAAGQRATLQVAAASATPPGSLPLTLIATAVIDGQTIMRSVPISLEVLAVGVTALTGRVLDTEQRPLGGVTLRIATSAGPVEAVTDGSGNFLMLDPPPGEQVLLIDGQTASTPTAKYPTIPTTVTLQPGVVNQLGFTPHLHQQKDWNFTAIDANTETVATDPELPGVALRIPAGTTIIGWDGQPNTQVSIRTVPIDRLPIKPLPPTVNARTVYMFYFGKVGGGVPSRPIPFEAPNDLGLAPGQHADLWYYDESRNPGEAPNDWRRAGPGTVSDDGKTIVTDPGVGIPKFCCGATTWSPPQLTNGPTPPTPEQDIGTCGGDPVELCTGIFILTRTDLVLPGRIPVTVTRTYRSGDSTPGAFGIGTTLGNNDLLVATSDTVLTYAYEGNARTQFFRQPDGSYVNETVPAFRGARITGNSGGPRSLRYKDGTTVVFDANGRQTAIRDPNGNEVTMSLQFAPLTIRDPSGRALELLGLERVDRAGDPLGRTVRYEYDAANRLIKVTDPAGGVTRYDYDAQHRMTAITNPRGIAFLRNTYDVNGRVCRQEHADGGTFTFYYVTTDVATSPESMQLLAEAAGGGPIAQAPCSGPLSSGRVVATVLVDARGHPTTHRFNGAGIRTAVTDALGQTTTFEYEPGSNLLKRVTDPLQRVTEYEYDSQGNMTRILDPAQNPQTFTYDSTFNRVRTITDALGQVIRFEYDARGNVRDIFDALRNQTRLDYNAFGQVIASTDPLNHTTTFGYDGAGNLATIVDPLGHTTTRTYDAGSRLRTQTDPRGRLTSFEYDALNRRTSITDPMGAETRLAYDANGNLLTVTDAREHTTSYAYDALDHLRTRTDALQASESFRYDPAGNLTRYTDRKGQTSTFSYDARDRRETVSYADGSTTTFRYDAGGRLRWALDSSGGTIQRDYDLMDRLTAETSAVGTVRYDYDAIGRRVRMTAPGQAPVTYGYDANSSLRTITQAPLNPVAIDYDPAGRRTLLTLPNGVSTQYQYDAASRLSALIYRHASGTLGELTYQYDPAGNRTRVGGSFAQALLPDAVAAATYDAANRQRSFGGQTLTYDANGNLLDDGVHAYAWNARNQLIGIDGPGLTASFGYDGLGRRQRKLINARSTEFVYDGLNPVQELTDANSAANLLTGLGIDEYFTRTDLAGSRYFLADAVGSTVALVDGAAVVQTRYSYEPYGSVTASGAPDGNPFQYTGRENDGTELYYYRARYYHPRFGRFISSDPIGLAGGVNTYAYVEGNPVSSVDPTGLDATICLYPGAGTAGHVGIGINSSSTVGFYPERPGISALTGTPGKVKPDANSPESCKTVKTSPADDKKMADYIAKRAAQPGNYSLTGNNCTAFVRSVLQQANIPTPFSPGPRPYFSDLPGQQ